MNRTFKTRFHVVSNSLRLIAQALEVADSPKQLRELLQSLETAETLIKMTLYRFDMSLMVNAAHNLDATEMQNIL